MDQARIRRLGKKCIIIIAVLISFQSCIDKEQEKSKEVAVVKPVDVYEFGFNLNDYIVKRDTIKSGDSFGEILERNQIGYPQLLILLKKPKIALILQNFK